MMDENCFENNKFWKSLEYHIGFEIPTFIKINLEFSGYNNPLSIQSIDETTIVQIEKNTKEIFKRVFPNATELQKKKIFDIFHESPDQFRFFSGHRTLIIELANYTKQRISERGLDFFKETHVRENSIEECLLEKKNTESRAIEPEIEQLHGTESSAEEIIAKKMKIATSCPNINIEFEKRACVRILRNCFENFIDVHKIEVWDDSGNKVIHKL